MLNATGNFQRSASGNYLDATIKATDAVKLILTEENQTIKNS